MKRSREGKTISRKETKGISALSLLCFFMRECDYLDGLDGGVYAGWKKRLRKKTELERKSTKVRG